MDKRSNTMATELKQKTKTGTITQIVGVVVDVEFSVRAIALSSTDGLERGSEVTDTGKAISVPVGDATLGRMFNVTGQPIDGKGGKFTETAPIHRAPPALIRSEEH